MSNDNKLSVFPENEPWPELRLPELLSSDTLVGLHATIKSDWDFLRRSACQTAAGRALWKQVIHDPLAELFAGETFLKTIYEKIKKDRLNNAREISGVILAVRTLWFDSKLEAALSSHDGGGAQVVLLGAGKSQCSNHFFFFQFKSIFPSVLQSYKQMTSRLTPNLACNT